MIGKRVTLTAYGTSRLVRTVAASVPTGTQDGGRSAPAVPAPERTLGRTVPVSASDTGQRWRTDDRFVANRHRRSAAAAQAFQLVRFIRARDHSVAQFVLGQTLTIAALKRVRRTSCKQNNTLYCLRRINTRCIKFSRIMVRL